MRSAEARPKTVALRAKIAGQQTTRINVTLSQHGREHSSSTWLLVAARLCQSKQAGKRLQPRLAPASAQLFVLKGFVFAAPRVCEAPPYKHYLWPPPAQVKLPRQPGSVQ